MDLVKIGRYVAGKRKELGLTQKQVADTLGMSDKSVSKWERGICLPDVSVYEEYCEILGISINEFLAGEDIEQANLEKKAEETLISIAADNSRRQKRAKAAIAALLVFAILAATVTFAVTNVSTSAKVARYERKAAYYQTQIDDLQQKINHYQVQISDVQEKARSLQQEEASAEAEKVAPDAEKAYLEAEKLLESGDIANAAMRFYYAAGYKDAAERSFALWDQLLPKQTISAGGGSMAVLQDGTVVAAGDWSTYRNNLASALPDMTAVIEVSYGAYVAAFLKADHTVEYVDLISGKRETCWKGIVKVSADGYTVLGLRADGQVLYETIYSDVAFVNWDDSSWTDIVDVDMGVGYAVGVKADGTAVAAWDYETSLDISALSGWSGIVSVSAGCDYVYGLKSDGTVVTCAIGSDFRRELGSVSNWKDIVAISAGWNNVVGLKSDGSVVAIDLFEAKRPVNVVAISAGVDHVLFLTADGTVIAVGSNEYGQCNVSGWENVRLP